MKFTEQERDFLKQEFADLCHAAINSMITAGSFVRSIDRIEAIVSERITPEPGSKSRERIVLERLLDKIKEAQSQGANYAIENEDVVAIALVLSINSPSAPITPEQDTIKPYHEHGNSVASDRTESGQSAEDVLKGLLNRGMYEFSYSANECLQAMHTYASQVCADKEADLQDMTAMRESAMRTVKNLADRIEPLQNEIDRLNESMTVMLRRNAELEAQIDQFTNPLRIK